MGLFDFGKKKNDTAGLKTAAEFYNDCVEDYHRVANENGYAGKGVILIPELIPLGSNAVLAYLKDSFFQMEFRDNPQQYYFVINTMCFMTGVVYAAMWHEDYDKLKSGFDSQVIAEGPPDYCNPILENDVGMTPEQANQFYQTIFGRWLAMHEPYWKLTDPREYTFNAMLASYQLGVSVVLEKYGY